MASILGNQLTIGEVFRDNGSTAARVFVHSTGTIELTLYGPPQFTAEESRHLGALLTGAADLQTAIVAEFVEAHDNVGHTIAAAENCLIEIVEDWHGKAGDSE